MLANEPPRVIALMGPTASGKSALAVDLAQRWNGEIISVDSALVYCGLNIGAAKPSSDEQGGIPHHLLDIRQPWQVYSAAEFATDAHAAITAITARGKLPILVGGTGLYFRALLSGFSPLPPADKALRAHIHQQGQTLGWPALHAQLAQIDPQSAQRIYLTDTQRITRALEVFRLTGQPLSYWQTQSTPEEAALHTLKLIVAPTDRAWLHQRIVQRFEQMLAQGFLDEVRALRVLPQIQALADPLQLPALRAVGYRQAWQFLDGKSNWDEFCQQAIAATRQLGKRQLTWLRSERQRHWFDAQTLTFLPDLSTTFVTKMDAPHLYDVVAQFLGR